MDSRIGNKSAAHTYSVEVEGHKAITVDANTRTQASALAVKHGYAVRSVNMIG